jgi:hypothetical protein
MCCQEGVAGLLALGGQDFVVLTPKLRELFFHLADEGAH